MAKKVRKKDGITGLMEEQDAFGGFETSLHKDDDEFGRRRKGLSRLQRQAPSNLKLLMPSNPVAMDSGFTCNRTSPPTPATTTTTLVSSYYGNKDPIPLLSPLVLPSMLHLSNIQQANPTHSNT